MHSKTIRPETLDEAVSQIVSQLSDKSDEELAAIFKSCLVDTYPRFPLQSRHAHEDPEDILWRILRSPSVDERMTDIIYKVLRDAVCEYVRILDQLERGEDPPDALEEAGRALFVIQKAQTPGLKRIAGSVANSVLAYSDTVEVAKHNFSYRALGAYKSCGLSLDDEEFWLRALEISHFAALSFVSLVDMGAQDMETRFRDLYNKHSGKSPHINFPHLREYMSKKLNRPDLVSKWEGMPMSGKPIELQTPLGDVPKIDMISLNYDAVRELARYMNVNSPDNVPLTINLGVAVTSIYGLGEEGPRVVANLGMIELVGTYVIGEDDRVEINNSESTLTVRDSAMSQEYA